MFYPFYPYLEFGLLSLAASIVTASGAGLIAWALRPKVGAEG